MTMMCDQDSDPAQGQWSSGESAEQPLVCCWLDVFVASDRRQQAAHCSSTGVALPAAATSAAQAAAASTSATYTSRCHRLKPISFSPDQLDREAFRRIEKKNRWIIFTEVRALGSRLRTRPQLVVHQGS